MFACVGAMKLVESGEGNFLLKGAIVNLIWLIRFHANPMHCHSKIRSQPLV